MSTNIKQTTLNVVVFNICLEEKIELVIQHS